jgi:hypothetical protein
MKPVVQVVRSSVLLIAMVASLWGADAFEGTWKLNLSKSTYPPGRPRPQEETTEIKDQGSVLAVVVQGIEADGKPFVRRYSYPRKGGPINGTNLPGTSEIRNRIDDLSMDQIISRDGKVVATARFVVSRDRKTLTTRATVKDSQGNPAQLAQVFERQ